MANKLTVEKTGKKIKSIRSNLNMTMDEFAQAIGNGTTKGTVNNWEHGRNLPNKNRLAKIASLGGIPVKALSEDIAIEIEADRQADLSVRAEEDFNGMISNIEQFTDSIAVLRDWELVDELNNHVNFLKNVLVKKEQLEKIKYGEDVGTALQYDPLEKAKQELKEVEKINQNFKK